MTGAFGADADCASMSHIPEARMSAAAVGNRPSTVIVASTDVNHVGGSMIAVSWLGEAPVIGLVAPPVLIRLTIPLRPLPDRVAAVRPVTDASVKEAGAVRPGTDVATTRGEEALQPRADRRVRRVVRGVGAGVQITS